MPYHPDGLIWILEHHWDLKIAIYLFFGGLAGGAYLTGFAADVLSRREDGTKSEALRATSRWGMIAAVVGIAVGGVILFTHLGAPLRALLFPILFVNFESWLVIGTWTIVLFTLVAMIQAFWQIWGQETDDDPSTFARWITRWIEAKSDLPLEQWLTRLGRLTRPGERLRLAVHAGGAFLAVLLVVYTALLLSEVAWLYPAWDGTLLPFLFLASGLSMGLAATAGLTGIFEGVFGTGVHEFSLVDDLVILAEIVILGSLVWTLSQGGPAAQATFELLRTDMALLFWGGVVALGLLAPLVLSAALLVAEWRIDLQATPKLQRLAQATYTAKFGLVVLGGLLLRYVALFMAVKAPLVVA
ncbi:polysulfide reductase NrfD [Halalkaliarchaeum desulfuricum]|uniref:Polysulfide reductase NrfD n=1 Tax=Halalkaliarchaeum desulfuricum TaxID=2055893 RepID=A0A343TKA7_9EURY|nr:NrfD/PsrC family molybdoenzyme membrane anchor subunit [Halalkaliarchaeum desulfuricum]AUX09529.1 polysulfide reductase NrfD [Halalkaliarchaeum desulfuricum]